MSTTDKLSAKLPADVKRQAEERVAREAGHPSLSYVVQELVAAYAAGRVDVDPYAGPPVDLEARDRTDAVLARVDADELSLNAAAAELGVSWPTARRMRDERARRLAAQS